MLIAKAPASTFLMGEHAVLAGYPALLCALDKWISVKLTPSSTDTVQIDSHLGSLSFSRHHLKVSKPLTFVTAVLCRYASQFTHGFHIEIESEFSHQQGLASSAAVTVATLAAIRAYLNLPMDPATLFNEARAVILDVQGKGSAADAAASIYGGCFAFHKDQGLIEHYTPPPFTLVYSGAKTPTAKVIANVDQDLKAFPEIQGKIYEAIGACVDAARAALSQKDYQALGLLANIHAGFYHCLQISSPILNDLIAAALQYPDVTGAKISGSGLGDCIIVFGALPRNTFPKTLSQKNLGVTQLSVQPSVRGVYVERD